MNQRLQIMLGKYILNVYISCLAHYYLRKNSATRAHGFAPRAYAKKLGVHQAPKIEKRGLSLPR